MIENEFIDEYNKLCDRHRKAESTLQDLTDHELYIWIAGKTMKYGRDFEASLKNAECHMKNRHKAEKQFSVKHVDLLNC